MAGSVNKVILVGNVGKDPETRTMQNGDKVLSFSLATSETWRDKQSGERREKTEWHNVVIFNEGLIRIAEQYVRKGSKLYLEGQIQTRKWQDQSGADRYTTEVVLQRYRGEMTLLDSRQGGGAGDDMGQMEDRSSGGSAFGRSSPVERRPAPAGGRASSGLDDDIPF